MATIKTGWLKDFLGNKFAPKTSISAVLDDNTGTSYKNTVNAELDKKVNKTDIIDIAHGGTNATTASGAQTNLGLDELLYEKNSDTSIYNKFNSFDTSFIGKVRTCGKINNKYYFISNNSANSFTATSAELNANGTKNNFSFADSFNADYYDIIKCNGYFIAATSYCTSGDTWKYYIYKSTNGYTWTKKYTSNTYDEGWFGSNYHRPTLYYDKTNNVIRMVGVINGKDANGVEYHGRLAIWESSDNGESWIIKQHSSVQIGEEGNYGYGNRWGTTIVKFFDGDNGLAYSTDGGVSFALKTDTVTSPNNIVNCFPAFGRYYYVLNNNTLYKATSLTASWGVVTPTASDESVFPTIGRNTQIISFDASTLCINLGDKWVLCSSSDVDNFTYYEYKHPWHEQGYKSFWVEDTNEWIFYNSSKTYSTYIIQNDKIINLIDGKREGKIYTLKNIDKTNDIKLTLSVPNFSFGQYTGDGEKKLIIPLPNNFQPYFISIAAGTPTFYSFTTVNQKIFDTMGTGWQRIHQDSGGWEMLYFDYLNNQYVLITSSSVPAHIFNMSKIMYHYTLFGIPTDKMYIPTISAHIQVNGTKSNNILLYENLTWRDYICTNSVDGIVNINNSATSATISYEDFYLETENGLVLHNPTGLPLKNESGQYVSMWDTVTTGPYTT